ncbi:MAG TPA: hypothetical protein VGB79_00845 [Allosphingosinicella sp.]|jgi:hypothetical protein
MDRERMLGPADPALQEGESFVEEQERRWGKFGTVLIGLSCVAAYRTYTMLTDDGRAVATPTAVEQTIAAAAAELRPQLPQRVDETTTMTGVSAEGRRLTYEATVAIDVPADELADAEAALTREQTTLLCGNAETRRAIEAGARFAYRMRDASGDLLRTEVFLCPR